MDYAGCDIEQTRALALCETVLRSLGAPHAHAKAQSELLVEADLRGRPSHGLQRLPTLAARINNGVLDPSAEPQLSEHTSSYTTVDGNHGFGPVAAYAALANLTAKAASSGIALAAVRNASHIGMLAPYVESIATAGQIALALTTSEALVHPLGGRTALLGTNPIGIGIPAGETPFVLDMSTAAISAGEIIAHQQRNTPLPAGRAIDKAGNPTTDPTDARGGAISPFGGAKGYGLGLAIELLVALLSATALGTEVTGTLDADRPATKGDIFIVIDPRVSGQDSDTAHLHAYLQTLRSSPVAPGINHVRIPGERMRQERASRQKNGIRYPQQLWQQLLDLERDPRVTDAR